jgi:hypothetical protein
MTQTISIEITDTQHKCLEYVSNPLDWASNAVLNRARIAQDEIVAKLVEHCNANNIALAVGADAQVTQAYDLGIVDTAANIAASQQSAVGA